MARGAMPPRNVYSWSKFNTAPIAIAHTAFNQTMLIWLSASMGAV